MQVGPAPAYDQKLIEMYTETMTTVSKTLSLSDSFRDKYENANAREQEFIQNLAMFLCQFFSVHLSVSAAFDVYSTG